jgi:hypothetical protein
MNVGIGGIDKERIEIRQSVVCCTQRFTDMVLVVQFRIKSNSKIFDLICLINVCTK